MAKKTTDGFDVIEAINGKILEAMQGGVAPWRKGWSGGERSAPIRHNGIPFTGGNVFWLWIVGGMNGFESPLWATFKQAVELGGMVRKGEKATMALRPIIVKWKDDKGEEQFRIADWQYYNVFNADQIDGLSNEDRRTIAPIKSEAQRNAEMDAFAAAIPAQINHGGNRAFYRPATDSIQMPELKTFFSGNEYYGTLWHELAHWTGHESRLDRQLSMKRSEYAFEELVAELSAVYTAAQVGGNPDIENSAAYLNSWIAALNNDKKFFWDAAKLAMKATDYLAAYSEKKSIAA